MDPIAHPTPPPAARGARQRGSSPGGESPAPPDDAALEARRVHSQKYLDISRPYILELLTLLGADSGCALLLTDGQGAALEVFGPPSDPASTATRHDPDEGVGLQDHPIVAKAMAMARKEGRPVQVAGPDRPPRAHSRLTCSAAPIFDANNTLIGAICLAADVERYQPFMLGLVGSIANAIESRIHSSYIQSQLYNAQQYAFSIMNRLSFGLLAMSSAGDIQWVNDTACRSLDRRRTKLIHTNIAQICPEWPRFKSLLDGGDQVQDEECSLVTRTSTEKYIISSYAIHDEHEQPMGYAVTFRPFRTMIPLINRYAAPPLRFTFEKIIYRSRAMHQLIEYARSIASTPSTVLLTGESGTGKEVFAQSIHNASERKGNPFIAINCGAISASLIESELFGYEEGAFTGAAKGGRPGKFELADRGTLFLDEIGEMAPDIQVKLLRILQDKIVNRVGGGKPLKVDVRLIAATNKNLAEEVKSGRFREDLYYRISVIPLHLPPLRERKMDILPLFKYFLKRKASRLDRPIPHVGPTLVQGLLRHTWPGNIRELENLAEKAVILQGNPSMLFPSAGTPQVEASAEQEPLPTLDGGDPLPSLETVEKALIERYLAHHGRNVSRTAKALGIGRNTLYQKMQKYRIGL